MSVINCIHKDFHGTGLSAVNTSTGLISGRPFGGTAILFKKSLATNICLVATNNSRITGIYISTSAGKIVLLNVYMPCNYGDEDSCVEYLECLSQLHALIVESDAIHTIIAGDFNCGPMSGFFPLLHSFATENSLIMADMLRLSNISACVSDDGLRSHHGLITHCVLKQIIVL